MAVHAAPAASRIGTLTPSAAAILRPLLFPEILGTALLWVAMWYFWFSIDRSHFLKKALWFVALALFAPLGPVFYYFFVFRQYARQTEAPETTAATR
jgi:hypothetical protein